MSNDIIPLFSTPVLKTSVDVSSVDTALLKSLEYVAYTDNSGCPHLQATYATGTVRPLTSEGNLFNADRWGIAVQKGDLTIFPSHLMHEVDVNKTDKDRYMIAFNYFLEGTIGDNTRQVKINVR